MKLNLSAKPVIIAAAILVIILSLNGYSQDLPLTGGTLTGTAIGPHFIQKGSVVDLAMAGTVTTNGTVNAGGATYRSFNSCTVLTAGQYITVDIGYASVAVNVISFGTNWSTDTRFIPAGYAIDYSSDNSTWTNFITVTGNTNLNPSYTPSITARYWRLTINAMQSGQTYCNISGLQLISTGSGSVGTDYWGSPMGSNGVFTNTSVGIGVNNPLAKLDVGGTGKFLGNLTTGNPVDASNGFQQVLTSNYNGIHNISWTGQFRWYTSPNNSTYKDGALYQLRSYDSGSNTENNILTMRGDGYIGIGTTSPNAKLHVAGTFLIGGGYGNIDGANLNFLANTGHTLIGWNRSGGRGETDFLSNQATGSLGGFAFYNHDNSNTETQLMYIRADGNVGIGSNNPVSLLSLNSNNITDLSINRAANKYARVTFSTAGVTKWYMGMDNDLTPGAETFIIEDPTAVRLAINGSGKVGIGTSSPDQLLTVKGTIHANEVKVDLNVPGPDYVFEPAYKLTPLADVKAYVDKNHHLPEVPSASEMAKTGIDLGDMNTRLLKKVEELTLYLIEKDNKDQQKDELLKQQQQQINELKTQVTKLAAQHN